MKAISIVWLTFFEGISLIKLKLLSFFNARYLTVSLRGPVLNLTARAKPEFVSVVFKFKRFKCCPFPYLMFDGTGWTGGMGGTVIKNVIDSELFFP